MCDLPNRSLYPDFKQRFSILGQEEIVSSSDNKVAMLIITIITITIHNPHKVAFLYHHHHHHHFQKGGRPRPAGQGQLQQGPIQARAHSDLLQVCQNCYMDLSKLLHVFVKVVTRICQSCYMYLLSSTGRELSPIWKRSEMNL